MRRLHLVASKLALGAVLLLGGAASASADTYGFDCISSNESNCDILEAQLAVEVTALGTTQVVFHFTNTGTEAVSITDVYFDDLAAPLLGGPVTITDSGSGVSFSVGCSPGNLPGGTSTGFSSTYCADSDSPVQPLGVNPGEYLDITYTLQSGATFDDVIDALDGGHYYVGLHAQGFEDGGSVSGVSRVPEPSSLVLLTMALGAFPLVRRQRSVGVPAGRS